MEIGLPTSPSCDDPEFVISVREYGSGMPFVAMPATIFSPGIGIFVGEIGGLEACTEYDVLVEVFCHGEIEGGCSAYRPYKTAGCIGLDCTPLSPISIDDEGFSIGLPTYGDCTEHEYVVRVRVHGSGLPYEPAAAVVTSPALGVYVADVSGLESCTSYDIIVDVFCDGELKGGCGIDNVKTTGCDDKCESCADQDCIKLDEISVVWNAGCTYGLIMGYAVGDCGTMTPVSVTWDMGYVGAEEVAGTLDGYVEHTFPGDGTYNITGTMVYTVDGVEYTCCLSIELSIRGCKVIVKDGPIMPDLEKRMPINGGINTNVYSLEVSTVPNPAEDHVTITVAAHEKNADFDQLELIIFNVNGSEVYRTNIAVDQPKEVDLSQLNSGLYIYTINNKEYTLLREKLIIK